MINKLVLENLKHRWVRTLLSALVVGVQVMSILTLIGLSRGLLEDSANRLKATGADIVLKPESGATLSLSTGQLSEKFVPFLAKQPHVTQAVGVLSHNVSSSILTMNGVNIPEFAKISPGFKFLSGGPPQNDPDGLIIDAYYAREHHLRVGDTVTLLNHPWHVTGIVEGGVLSRLVVDLSRLQWATGNGGKITEILVKLDDPARTNEEVTELNKLLEGSLKAISMADLVSQFSINNIPSLKAFIWVIVALAVVVGFLVVFLSMYTAVLERTREIGILKALGAQPGTIIGILIREAFVLAAAGCVIGIVLSFGAKALIMAIVPASLQVVNVPDWWPISGGIAILGALLGAIYPGLKAARQDAIEALAYD
ncbi:MAG TPA: FtsX-like permease family protein [Bryobacteraceae bacterium]|jgi:putative ABC transport system permease protein|nr:FtsX-like permease family protein [Bryobacteraceae bacterium]